MGALAKTDLTVVVTEKWINGRKKHVRGTLAIAGTNTYPDGGIPMPDLEKFGFVRQLDVFAVFGVNATAGTVADYMVRYDKANHKLLMFEEEGTAAGGPLLECDTSEVPGARTYNFEAIGW